MVKRKSKKKVEKKEDKVEAKSKIKINYWMAVSVILAVLLLINGIIIMTSGISKATAEKKFLEFAQSQGADVEVLSVESVGGLYEITFDFSGQEDQFHVSKDGKYIGQMMTLEPDAQANNDPVPTNAPKSEKPILEAVVTPYCPYGLQYMKGLIPVYELLKEEADIQIISLGVTHMQNEEIETKRQSCIKQEYGNEELFGYLKELIYDEGAVICYSEYHDSVSESYYNVEAFDNCMGPFISSIMVSLNLDETKIDSCIVNDGESLYNAAVSKARSLGAEGSPSPFVNGVSISNAGRSPEGIKNALCSAFNTSPEDCSVELSSYSPAPGITSITSGGASTAQC